MANGDDAIDPKKHAQNTKKLDSQMTGLSKAVDQAGSFETELAKIQADLERAQKDHDYEEVTVQLAKMQTLVAKHVQIMNLMSNVLKMLHDTNKAIMANLH